MAANQFSIGVDAQHRALQLRYFSLQKPHARAFHAAYLAFFAATFATFAVPSVVTVIRDDLDLTDSDITNGAIASIAGIVGARLVMGTVCELLGPRLGSAALLLCCSSATFGMALATNAATFIAVRLLMGFAMATFVFCQYWTSITYSPPVVGAANGLAAGLANSGAGFTHLFCMGVLAAAQGACGEFVAWRLALLPPGALQVLVALGVLAFSQDCPDGDYRELRRQGLMQRPPLRAALRQAGGNFRVYLLAAVYAASFGVELTINNFIQQYLQDQFGLGDTIAAVYASLYGICNIAARPLGGVISDAASRRWGLRGRLCVVALLTALAGGACMALGAASSSLGGTIAALVGTAAAGMGASGAVWGVAPFLAPPTALGVVAGVVGAAGPIGALVLSSAIMATHSSSKDTGFFYVGIVELCVAPLALAIALPLWQRRRHKHASEDGSAEGGCKCTAQQAQQAEAGEGAVGCWQQLRERCSGHRHCGGGGGGGAGGVAGPNICKSRGAAPAGVAGVGWVSTEASFVCGGKECSKDGGVNGAAGACC